MAMMSVFRFIVMILMLLEQATLHTQLDME